MDKRNTLYDFDDILIEPAQFSTIRSRKEINIKNKMGFLPLMTAPMDTVISEKNCHLFEELGIRSVLPRSSNKLEISYERFLSYGLDEFEEIFIKNDLKIEDGKQVYALIDIANGHMGILFELAYNSKIKYGDKLVLMVGNVANPETFLKYCQIGVDYVRIGIGNGGGCWVENTLVKTINGYKNIQDIDLNEMVLTHIGNYKEVINKVSYEIDGELTIINGEICTNDHEIYVIKKEDVILVNENNFKDFAFFISAENVDENKHFILSWDVV
jgi:hypothetical protein